MLKNKCINIIYNIAIVFKIFTFESLYYMMYQNVQRHSINKSTHLKFAYSKKM